MLVDLPLVESSGFRALAMYVLRRSIHRSNGRQEKEIRNTRFWTEVRAGITTFFTM
jgi:hypothetical protein